MARPIFGTRNFIDSATLSGGSYQATLPLTNLQDRRLAKIARSTTDATADTQFLATLDKTRLIRAASLHAFNLSLAGRIRVRAYPTTTFTRTGTTATYHDKEGVVQATAANEERRNHWIEGERTTLLEEARDNECVESEDLSTTWANIGTPTLGTPHTAAGISIDLLGDNDGAAAEGKSQTVAFTGDAVKAISVYWKAGPDPTPGGDEVILHDTSAVADRLHATITQTGGVPSVAMTTGTFLGGDEDPLADGVYRLLFATTAVTAANTNSLRLYAGRLATVGDTGDVYFGGIQAEDALAPSSYIATTTVAVTRNDDTLFAPFTPVPQEMTVYAKFVEGGTKDILNAGVLHVGGTSSGGDARFQIHSTGAGLYTLRHDNGVTNTSVSQAAGPAIGDTVEFRGVLNADGSLAFGQSINGGTETVVTDATVTELQGAWNDTRIYINSRGTAEMGLGSFVNVLAESGTKTLAEMQALEKGDLFAYQPYDSGLVNPYEVYPADTLQPGHNAFGTTTLDQEDLDDGYPVNFVDVFQDGSGNPTPINADFVNFEIIDTTNPDTFVDIGRAFLVYGYQPSHGISIGARLGYQTSSKRSETDGGSAFYNVRVRRRQAEFMLRQFQENESLVYLLEIDRFIGTTTQMLFISNPDATVHMHRESFLCTLERLNPLAFARSQFNDHGFSLLEDL